MSGRKPGIEGPRPRCRHALLRGSLLAFVLAVHLGAPVSADSPVPTRVGAAEPLAARLESVLRSSSLRQARIGALVVRDSDARVIFEHEPDRRMIPASNQKILTALAALDVFGPAHRFETVVFSNAPPDSAGRVANLMVRGGGDPVLNSEDWLRLALALHRTGVRHVVGDLIIDDGAFDRMRWHPSWGRVSARAYHAPVGALSANYAHFSVTIGPGQQRGDAALVEVNPPIDYLSVSSRATTASRGSVLRVDRRVSPDGETVLVDGAVRLGSKAQTFYRSVIDPARYAAAVLRWQLEANGIQVDGVVRLAPVAPGAHQLLSFEGRPMAEIVRLFMKYSNNAIAETLVKAMGVRMNGGVGSWASGMPVLRHALSAQRIDVKALKLVDGSGLSRENRVTARALVTALRRARASFRFGPEFVASLPIAAIDGTLERRASDSSGRVRGKTGLLDAVTSLSGYAQLADGELAAFSILVNGYEVSDAEAMGAVDRFAAELVRPVAAAALR